MTPERKAILEAICQTIGCSGQGQKCPGNPACSLLRSAASHPACVELRDEFLETAKVESQS
jgi:hypothetical protein